MRGEWLSSKKAGFVGGRDVLSRNAGPALGPEKNLGHSSRDSRSVIDVFAAWGIEIEPDGLRMKPGGVRMSSPTAKAGCEANTKRSTGLRLSCSLLSYGLLGEFHLLLQVLCAKRQLLLACSGKQSHNLCQPLGSGFKQLRFGHRLPRLSARCLAAPKLLVRGPESMSGHRSSKGRKNT